MRNKSICIDIDDTICNSSEDYSKCRPKPGAIEALTRLKQDGNFIILHTGRHINHAKITIEWLREWFIPFDHVMFNKPPAELYVDDKGYKFEGWAKFNEDMEGRA